MEQVVKNGKAQFWKKRDEFHVIKGVLNRFYIRRARFGSGCGPIHIVFRGYKMNIGTLTGKVTDVEEEAPKYSYREYAPDEVLEIFISTKAKDERDERDIALSLAEYLNEFPDDTEFEFVLPTEMTDRIFDIMRRNISPMLMRNAMAFYELGGTRF